MASLYEISNELRQLLIDTDELDPVMEEKIDKLSLDLYAKCDGVCRVLAEIEGEAAAYKHEIDRLSATMQVKTNAVARLKNYLKTSLETIGETKFKTTLFSLSVCKNAVPSVDIDPERASELPEEFQRLKVEANKKALGDAWKEGKELPGFVSVTQGTHLRIK